MAFSVQAQTINICGRTQQVVSEILRQTPADDACDSVLVSETDSITLLNLFSKGITSLQSGDFHGLSNLVDLFLDSNQLRELPSDVFSGLSQLNVLRLYENDLNTLPAGIFSELTSLLLVNFGNNPGAPFRLTLRFDPATLDEDFTTASVKLVLREGAPRPVTVPLGVVGATLSADSLTLNRGDIVSDAVTVTRDDGGEHFALIQRKPELGGRDQAYFSLIIVRGPSIVIDAPTVRIRVFLEGALE